MKNEIIEDDLIVTTTDLPKHNVAKGTQGKVLSIRQPGTLFEVDFVHSVANVSIRQLRKVEC